MRNEYDMIVVLLFSHRALRFGCKIITTTARTKHSLICSLSNSTRRSRDVPLRREDVVMKNVLRHNFVPPPVISSAAQDLPRLPSAGRIDVQEHNSI